MYVFLWSTYPFSVANFITLNYENPSSLLKFPVLSYKLIQRCMNNLRFNKISFRYFIRQSEYFYKSLFVQAIHSFFYFSSGLCYDLEPIDTNIKSQTSSTFEPTRCAVLHGFTGYSTLYPRCACHIRFLLRLSR